MIAGGSLAELATQWEIAVELELIRDNKKITDLLAEVDRVLSALVTKLQAKK
jgi:four helix bundle protein